MKQLLFLFIFCLIIWNIPTTAQEKIVVKLNVDEANFVDQLRIDVSPGDVIQFESINGDFAIYIIDAISFLPIEANDLKIRVNSDDPENSKSKAYEVQTPTEDKPFYYYSIYCISNNSWPDAPPRIIITVVD